jgi:hypothetical protein
MGCLHQNVKVPPEACFYVYLVVNAVSIVARILRKLNLSAIQVLEILSQISQ